MIKQDSKIEWLKDIIENDHSNDLELYVTQWVFERSGEYDNLEDIFRDLSHGCATGIVPELVYTQDCVEFYETYREDIDRMISELIESTGMSIHELFRNWDETDPFARNDYNKNQLAWFGFEETAHRLASELQIEI